MAKRDTILSILNLPVAQGIHPYVLIMCSSRSFEELQLLCREDFPTKILRIFKGKKKVRVMERLKVHCFDFLFVCLLRGWALV